MTRPAEARCDVAVVGCGPVGATLAALLGRMGLDVVVIDRANEIHQQPRAVGFDHDAMRIFQRIGITDALAPHIAPFRDAVYLGADGAPIRRVQHVAPPYPYTWAPNYSCDQPGVEAVLRAALAAMPNVAMRLGEHVARCDDGGAGVTLRLQGAAGASTLRAQWVVACDGASSELRRAFGIALHSLDYDESWIVVDMRVGDEALQRLPATNVQYCEPERPCTHVVCPGNHRRWEFMLLAGEPREGTLSETRLWALLARWLVPGEADIRRAAAYRFHALVADPWRRGRVLLAGDAAHQTPPFLGQGMCQGLRDAGNLAWKLARVVRGEADAALLDTYATERRPHVIETTRIAKALGQLISERDPERARARDAALRAGGARTVIRQDLIPGLDAGLLGLAPLAGRPMPQPVVSAGARRMLLDDLHRDAFRLVVDARLAGAELDRLVELATARRLPCVVLGAGLTEQAPLVHDLLAAARCSGALVRPDHYVYGGFATAAEAQRLADSLGPLRAAAPAGAAANPDAALRTALAD